MSERSHDPRRFLTKPEQQRIVLAIGAAERRTSAEIRLYIERDSGAPPGDAYLRARDVFARLGMHETDGHNGVLIYLAVRSRRFAIVGDEQLHRAVGDDFWAEVRDRLAADFADGRFVAGLETAIAAVADSLARLFPRGRDDANELPDDIAY